MSRIRLTRIASITSELDRIAGELETSIPEAALALDQISDQLEGRTAAWDYPKPMTDTEALQEEVMGLAIKGDTSILSNPKYKKVLDLDYTSHDDASPFHNDHSGNTPVHYLAQQGKTEILKPEFKKLLENVNDKGSTPVHLLAMRGKTEILNPDYQSFLKDILKLTNDHGNTPEDILENRQKVAATFAEVRKKILIT